jgi:hypothetical protein
MKRPLRRLDERIIISAMKSLLSVLVVFSLALPAFADVLIYSGSAAWHRPGKRTEVSAAFLVFDSATNETAVVTREGSAVQTLETTIAPAQINVEGARVYYLFNQTDGLPVGLQRTWVLTTNIFRQNPDPVAIVFRPRSISGHIFDIRPIDVIAPDIINVSGGVPTSGGQGAAATFSDLTVAFSLDGARTNAAKKANRSFSEVETELGKLVQRR